MTDWQFLETKLIISVSLKAGRLTKQSKNVIYSDINDTKMPLNKDRLGSHQSCKLTTTVFRSLRQLKYGSPMQNAALHNEVKAVYIFLKSCTF